MEFLKEFLGDDLYTQVETKLKNNDKVKLVNLASGEYISKGKFNNLEQAKKELEDTIIKRDQDLEALKKAAKGNEGLQKQFDDLQTKYDAESKAHETKIKDMQMSAALKLELAGKVHDADLVAGLINKEQIVLDDNGAVKSGLKEQVETLSKEKAFLFVPQNNNNNKFSGVKPADGSSSQYLGNGDAGTGNEESMGQRLGKQQAEAAKAMNENPYFK